jgi:2-polyprenyl-3-methyl-5-hydroxy-6-metoxy-1,4-benzoquinol methylase
MPILVNTIERHLPAVAPWAPLMSALLKNGWLLRPMLESLDEEALPAYFENLADIWRTLAAVRPIEQAARIDEVIKGLQFHSMEFLKLQIQFAKTGTYKSSDTERIHSEIYQAGSVMQRYLDGLLLTYVAWPNHYRLLSWYRQAYLARGPYGQCLEVGPGHGWLALEQLRANAENRLTALDVSPHSVAYTRQVLTVNGIDPARYDVRQANAQRALDTDIPCFSRIVIAEVLEHVEDPAGLMRLLVERADATTLFFVTTVVNIEAPDHIYLFRSLEEVRQLLAGCGLDVLDELDLPLRMNLALKEPAYEVALVCRRSPQRA